MKFIKKYTIMFVPFNQEKVIRFNITNISIFFISAIFLLLFTLTALSIFSNKSSFLLREEKISNIKIKETVSIFNNKFDQNRKGYLKLKKEIKKFIHSYYPIFYQRYKLGKPFTMLEEVNFLSKILSQFTVFYTKVNRFFSTIPTIFPVLGGGKITSGFGLRVDPFTQSLSFHTGVDIPKLPGTPIRASGSGLVILADWSPSYGFVTRIEHSYGFMSVYAHQIAPPLVKEGDEVKQGQIIGHVGSTGRTVGYHLHYEVRNSGKYLNPENFIFLKR